MAQNFNQRDITIKIENQRQAKSDLLHKAVTAALKNQEKDFTSQKSKKSYKFI